MSNRMRSMKRLVGCFRVAAYERIGGTGGYGGQATKVGVRYEVSGKGSTASSIEPVGGGRPSVCRRRPKQLMPAVNQP